MRLSSILEYVAQVIHFLQLVLSTKLFGRWTKWCVIVIGLTLPGEIFAIHYGHWKIFLHHFKLGLIYYFYRFGLRLFGDVLKSFPQPYLDPFFYGELGHDLLELVVEFWAVLGQWYRLALVLMDDHLRFTLICRRLDHETLRFILDGKYFVHDIV